MDDQPLINARPDVFVDGESRPDLAAQMDSLMIQLPWHGCASAELSATNWGLTDDGSLPAYLFGEIGMGARVRIAHGNPSVTLFEGEVTGIEEEYGESAPGLTLLLQDRLHHLGRRRQSQCYEDRNPDDLLRTLGSDAGLEANVAVSGLTTSWHQLNESDLAFALRLCQRFDIGLRMDQGALRAMPEEPDPEPVILGPGNGALSIRILADLNHQYQSSEVTGFNPNTAESVDASENQPGRSVAGRTARDTLSELGWESSDTLPHPLARSQSEANAYASAGFQRQARKFLRGDLTCMGESGLKPGREIRLEEVSPRLRGVWQVGLCRHVFNNRNGFRTHAKIHRAHWSQES
jgi:phage protein D